MMAPSRKLSIIPDDDQRFDIYLRIEGRPPEYIGPVDAIEFKVHVARKRQGLPRVIHAWSPSPTPLLFVRRRPQ